MHHYYRYSYLYVPCNPVVCLFYIIFVDHVFQPLRYETLCILFYVICVILFKRRFLLKEEKQRVNWYGYYSIIET